MATTGDLTNNKSFQTYASAFPFTMVPVASLNDASDPVNQTHLSGKREGGGFVGDDYGLYIATGSEPTDKWALAGAAGTADVTPT